MALTFLGDTDGVAGTSSVTPNAPSEFTVEQGDHVLILLAYKRTDATFTTPDGWTVIATATVGTGSPGAGDGPISFAVLHHQVTSSGLTVPTITMGGNSSGRVVSAGIVAYRGGLGVDGELALASASGSDTTNDTAFSVTAGSAIAFEADDEVLVLAAVTDNLASNPTSPALSLPAGLSATTLNNPYNNGTGNGDDMRVSVYRQRISSGSASGAPTLTSTLPSASTGGALFMRLRETASSTVTKRMYLSNGRPSVSASPSGFLTNNDAGGNPLRLTEEPQGGPDTQTIAETSSSADQWVLLGIWTSEPLATAGTLYTDATLCVGMWESDGAANLDPFLVVGVTEGDSPTVRRGIAANQLNLNAELPTDEEAYLFHATVADPQWDGEIEFQPGDRIFVQVGYKPRNTSSTPYSATIAYGGIRQPDLKEGDSDVAKCGWIDLKLSPGVRFAKWYEHVRLYPTHELPARVEPDDDPLPIWTDPDPAVLDVPRRMPPDPAGAVDGIAYGEDSSSDDYRALMAWWVSDPVTTDGVLPGGVPWRLCMASSESHSDADLYWVAGAWVMKPDGTARAQLWGASEGDEWPVGGPSNPLASVAFDWHVENVHIPNVEIFAGDRVVLEVGYFAENTTTEVRSGVLIFGGEGTDELRDGDTGSDLLDRPAFAEIPVSPGLRFVEPDPPGEAFNLTPWKITLPTEDPEDPGDADEVTQPELDTYADEHFYLDAQGRMTFVAPTSGPGIVTTSGSEKSRSELREMTPDGLDEAAWSIFDPQPRSLTVSGYFDPTSITGGEQPRQEMIVGQIHGELGNPPIYIAAEYHVATPRLRVFKYNGAGSTPGYGNLVEGISPTTLVTYRLEYDPGADPANGTGRLKVYGAIGGVDDLPSSPQFTFAPADFYDQTDGWYFKVGAYNKTDVVSGSDGAAVTKVTYLELVQPTAATVTGTAAAALGALTADADGQVVHVVYGAAAAGPAPVDEYPSENLYPSENTYPGDGLPNGLGGLAATATGVVDTGVEGTAAAPLGALDATAIGQRAVLAAAAATLGGLDAQAVGEREVDDAAAAAPLGALTATATGIRETPGAGSVTLGALSATAAAVREVEGSAAAPLGGLVASGASERAVTGSAAAPLGVLAADAVGARAVLAAATGALPFAATATATRAVEGTATAVLGGLDAQAVGEREVDDAAAAAPLGALTATAAGQRTVHAAAAAPLGALHATGAAEAMVQGSGAAPLGSLSAAATGRREIAADATAALGGVIGTAAGVRQTAGSGSTGLGALTATATGAVAHPGVAAAGLGDLSAAAAGQRTVLAAAAGGLGGLTATADGYSSGSGEGAADLGGLDAHAAGRRTVHATGGAPLGGLDAHADGAKLVYATGAAALGALNTGAAGRVDHPATAAAGLGALAADGVGEREVVAVAVAPLGGLDVDARGSVTMRGHGTAVLGALVVTADGVAVVVADEALAALGGLDVHADGQPRDPNQVPHADTPVVRSMFAAATPVRLGVIHAGQPYDPNR